MRSTGLAAKERFDADAVTLGRPALDFTDQSGHGGVDVALGEDRVDVAGTRLRQDDASVEGEDRVDVAAGNDRVDIAAGNDRVDVAGVDYLSIFTPELRRSVDFYSRVFGFCVVDASRRPDGRSVLMGAGRFCLALHERQRAESDSTRTLSWSFIVDDLDRARAIVWNLGIVPLRRGAQEPQRNTPWRRSRSFMIRDPNGNEIEVVQQPR